MTYYKVTGLHITFCIGMVLKLKEEQSIIRAHALTKKGSDIFVVKSPVQFKHGEVIGIVKGHLSRTLGSRLQVIENKKSKSDKPDKPPKSPKHQDNKTQPEKPMKESKPQPSNKATPSNKPEKESELSQAKK